MKEKDRISSLVDELIKESEELIKTKWQPKVIGARPHVDLELFAKVRAKCRLLLSLLGPLGTPWKPDLENNPKNLLSVTLTILGSLRTIKEAIEEGLLLRFEDLILADAFVDFLEQAKYLFNQGYLLASGVILRAILEERLKKMCESNNCVPEKDRPTISDYNQSLYKEKIYDKIIFKHVDSMTSIGNDAAHNKADLRKEDIERFMKDLEGFLQRFSG